MIKINQIIQNEIVEFIMIDKCCIDEVINILKENYSKISHGILWNLEQGSIANLTTSDMKYLARSAAKYAKHKKTAYLGSVNLEFGLLRMYESYADFEAAPPAMKVFRYRNEALQWLKKDE